MLKKTPLILLLAIIMIAVFHPWISLPIKSCTYAIALSIKAALVFTLPFLIFLLIFKTSSEMARSSVKLIPLILCLVIVSNFSSTFTSFHVGKFLHSLDISISLPEKKDELSPLWTLKLPSVISNGLALLAGAAFGVLSIWLKDEAREKIRSLSEKMISLMLKSFLYMIPIFVIGFVVKLAHDQILYTILKDYSRIFVMIALTQAGYIFLLYLMANRLRIKSALLRIKNMLPAAFVGFGAMSSAAAMPLTLVGAAKNATNSDIARSCIPATVNIHLIGDCLAIPLFAFAILKNFSLPMPDMGTYLVFTLYFVLAKFSVAAIPGGGIIVMLPILEKHLGFSAEMLSLITALYILFDPVITFTNVLGNGAFSLAIDKMYSALARRQTS